GQLGSGADTAPLPKALSANGLLSVSRRRLFFVIALSVPAVQAGTIKTGSAGRFRCYYWEL
ncbi:MAG: hypothetical protein PT958_06360, partial [Firmicutes bacterium]|nr:hypothetical protein [Bacillota bacterium]